jgi:hypothetical protein
LEQGWTAEVTILTLTPKELCRLFLWYLTHITEENTHVTFSRKDNKEATSDAVVTIIIDRPRSRVGQWRVAGLLG